MCAACVAQGVAYAGGALAGLQVMAVRARHRRGAGQAEDARDERTQEPESTITERARG
jgi:hypothetical protein